MSDEKYYSAETRFLDEHTDFRKVMRASENFAEIKQQAAVMINGERLFIVRSDNLGDEEELFLDALARGAQASSETNPAHRLFMELNEKQQALFKEYFNI